MRPSLPPDMGDNAAAQATLEARLRREQVKRVSHVEDLANVTGNATDGQALIYSQAKGAWQPSAAAGQRYSTIVIAASNSYSHATRDADFVCTGTNDDATLQAAVNAIRSGPYGYGQILLMDGTYSFGTTGVSCLGTVAFAGMGRLQETIISVPGTIGNNFHAIDQATTVANLTITVAAHSATGVYLLYLPVIVKDLFCQTSTGGGICVDRPLRATNFLINQQTSWLGFTVDFNNSVVCDGLVSGGGGYEIFSSAVRPIVHDVVFDSCANGAVLATGTESLIHHCIVQNGTAVGVDAISVNGVSTRVRVSECTVRRNSGSMQYGVNVLAGATGCIVVNNDLRSSGTVASFLDSGTGTFKNLDGSANNWNLL